MAAGGWQITAAPAVGSAASATQAATASTSGLCTRLRSLEASIACTASAAATQAVLQVLNGGAAIFNRVMSGNNPVEELSDLDLRADPGSVLTIQFTTGGPTSALHAVNGQGDLVPVGYPLFLP